MKRFEFFAGACFSLLFIFVLTLPAQTLGDYPNYVVIGAFAHHNNAIHFTDEAHRNNFPAKFEMNSNRSLYYVYVLTTADRELAMSHAIKLRSQTKYFDTWVYSGPMGATTALQSAGVDFDPETGNPLRSIDVKQKATRNSTSAGSDEKNIITTESSSAHEGDRSPSQQTVGNNESSDQKADMGGRAMPSTAEDREQEHQRKGLTPTRASVGPLQTKDVEGKEFYFHLFRADNLKIVDGEVDAIDFEKSRKMASYPGNEPVTVRMPAGGEQRVSFVCQVFGYRKQQKEFDPAAPAEDLYLDDSANLVVPFELVRLQKGDIAIMYNVFFFKDAAVIRPESRFEVNNLLDLLNENPAYRIRIHGHTNGNASGKIIRMDKPGNFYSLSGSKQGFGSAKKLSEERAIVIKEYLVSSGIDQGRMEIRAWGGKKPLHDKHSVRANENVRVEIEILSE